MTAYELHPKPDFDALTKVDRQSKSLGQIGIFLIFIAVLLFRPQGMFGARA